MIATFREQLNNGIKEEDLQYEAGYVGEYNNEYIVTSYQIGASETFSVGQPIYDKFGNLLGYLGIGCFDRLSQECKCEIWIPAIYWKICKATHYCEEGIKVFSYWQNMNSNKKEGE